jgi:antitoxin component HigA of HigAB toxin-antitoxin module
MADVTQFFDKAYEQKEFNELADAPVDAIQELSQGDAEKLQQAFNVKTVRDLAENKFVRIAQAVVALSGSR